MSSPQQKSGTDFATLKKELGDDFVAWQGRSWTDWMIDCLTPLLVFFMVASVMYFLVDVRYVFSEYYDANLRFVVFFFAMGIVALNRLIARDGQESSILYMLGFGVMVFVYSLVTPIVTPLMAPIFAACIAVLQRFFGTGILIFLLTVFMFFFDTILMMFLWWMTSRLVHECCVDENPFSGDIGMMTNSAKRLRKAMKEDTNTSNSQGFIFSKRDRTPVLGPNVIAAFDPSTDHLTRRPKVVATVPIERRPLKRHPGISIFYFSIPVLLAFTLGLRALQHFPERMILGQVWLGIYLTSSLGLLMLSSQGGFREYFRQRKIKLPSRLGWFWNGLGFTTIVIVLMIALAIPRPGLPPMMHLESHEILPGMSVRMQQQNSMAAPIAQQLREAKFMTWCGRLFLISMGLFVLYGVFKGLVAFLAHAGRHRAELPPWGRRLLTGIERFLDKLAKLPGLLRIHRRRRIWWEDSLSYHYRNSMGDPARAKSMSIDDHVSYAYEALRALAADMGAETPVDQTPLEFVEAFPKELNSIRDVSLELIELLHRSAYSNQELADRAADRVRKFWLNYERTRNRVFR